jgi:hypothetical protein
MAAPFQLSILQVKSYVRTDCQLASLSWNKAPICGLRKDFYYCQTVAGLLTRGRVCRLQLLLALVSAVILGSESRGTRDHILLSQIRGFPFRRLLRLAGLRWRYPTPPPHGIAYSCSSCPPYNPSARTTVENPVSNGASVVACV